jgi:integrase/recombinase XerC
MSKIIFKKLSGYENNNQYIALKIIDSLDVGENTRNEYRFRVKMFLNYIKDNGFHRNSFLDFKRLLSQRNDFSVSTKNKYLTTARIFLKEMNRLGLLPADITQNIKSFKQSRKHKRFGLDDNDISLLSEWLRQLSHSQENTRLKAILCLLTYQGLRQVEVVGLSVPNVDLVNHTVSIIGKGRDDREMVSLHPETVKAIQEYLKTNNISDGPLFVSRSNHNHNRKLTTRGLRQIVKDTLKELGIDKTIHGFRHYFATKLLKTYKGDLLTVAQYTRHRSLEMLQVYNDNIKHQEDLPRFYRAFNGVQF